MWFTCHCVDCFSISSNGIEWLIRVCGGRGEEGYSGDCVGAEVS